MRAQNASGLLTTPFHKAKGLFLKKPGSGCLLIFSGCEQVAIPLDDVLQSIMIQQIQP